MDRERSQSQVISDDLLYVIIVVKRPLLALRYRLQDGQVISARRSMVSTNVFLDPQTPDELPAAKRLRHRP